MGCDIHAMIEKKGDYYSWINCGDPEIERNYEFFAILGNVRNDDNIPFISDRRGMPDNCSSAFADWHNSWNGDAHSASWVTLKEMQEYDLNQEFYDSRLILKRDDDGTIRSVCGGTTGKHEGPVGMRKVFALWGAEKWEDLIKKMEQLGEDDEVRLVFFFDN